MSNTEIILKNTSLTSPNLNEITLKEFLQYVSEEISVIEDIETIKQDKEKALNTILKVCKAKKYVGAGVGGLLIDEQNNKVLLYFRPKEPEKYKWSMPGGSIGFGENATSAIINEYKNIVGLNNLRANDLIPLRITNHKQKELTYHFLSPAFIFKTPSKYFQQINRKISNNKEGDFDNNKIASEAIEKSESEYKRLVNLLEKDLRTGDFYLKDWEKDLKSRLNNVKFQKYIVKWFDISEVTENSDKISIPTHRALESYKQRINTINNTALEIKNILIDATNNTEGKIKQIKIEDIIQTDD